LISDNTDTGKQITSKTRAAAGDEAPEDLQLRKSSTKSHPLGSKKSEQRSPSASLDTSANSPSWLPNEESPHTSSAHSQRSESVSPSGDLRPAADDPGPAKEPTTSPPLSTASKIRELGRDAGPAVAAKGRRWSSKSAAPKLIADTRDAVATAS
ncbi:hypothetical protein KC355_g17867, partial [Hortaea werneckii]